MYDAMDLYRQTKAAQARAEASGFLATAAAIAAVAEMIVLEAGVQADPRLTVLGPGPAAAVGLPIYRAAQT